MNLEEPGTIKEAGTSVVEGPEDNDGGLNLVIELTASTDDEEYWRLETLAHTGVCGS